MKIERITRKSIDEIKRRLSIAVREIEKELGVEFDFNRGGTFTPTEFSSKFTCRLLNTSTVADAEKADFKRHATWFEARNVWRDVYCW